MHSNLRTRTRTLVIVRTPSHTRSCRTLGHAIVYTHAHARTRMYVHEYTHAEVHLRTRTRTRARDRRATGATGARARSQVQNITRVLTNLKSRRHTRAFNINLHGHMINSGIDGRSLDVR